MYREKPLKKKTRIIRRHTKNVWTFRSPSRDDTIYYGTDSGDDDIKLFYEDECFGHVSVRRPGCGRFRGSSPP